MLAYIELSDSKYGQTVQNIAGLGGIVSVILFCTGIIGACAVWSNNRIRRVLRSYPWIPWQMSYEAVGREEYVELRDNWNRPVTRLMVSKWRRSGFDEKSPVVWFAGDPYTRGVLSAPGGGSPRYAEYADPAQSPPPPAKPATDGASRRHGANSDDRYPSPRRLRRIIAFVIDWSIHFGGGAAVVVLGEGHIPAVGAWALGTWIILSFTDRVVIQGYFHTTIGKSVFDLYAIRPDNGELPSYGRLTKIWFTNLFYCLLPVALDAAPDNLGDYFLTAVRKRDLRRE
ncbi:hypothetical protein ACL02S_17230 [Nocardia sp. 004]|uniref:hypothetical protein n=1 Tax=Nocardia sp. 004 TaxID=3385978 RepID=UPI0039A10F24